MLSVKRKKEKELEPSQSILKNDILKTAVFSIIASISVLSMSFYFAEYSESTTIKDVGLIFWNTGWNCTINYTSIKTSSKKRRYR